MHLHRQLQALACAQLGARFHLEADDDWLTPGVPKQLQTFAWCPSDAMADAPVTMVAPGHWQSQARPVEASLRSDDPRLAPRHTAEITVSDLTFVERLLPVIAYTKVTSQGETLTLSDITYLECNRPFEIRKPKGVLTVVAGRTGQSGVTLRNWSPNDVLASLAVDGPPGWTFLPERPPLSLPALTDTPVTIPVSPPADAKRGSSEVWVRAYYTPDPASEVKAVIRVALLPSLVPVSPGASPQAVAADNQAHLRRDGKLVIYAKQGETIKLAVSSLQAGNYNATGRYVFRAPDLSVLSQDSIPLNETREVNLPAPDTGTYYLEVTPGVGQAVVTTENPYVGELATEQEPLNLFCSAVTRHFYVPPGSKGFELCAQDGGPDETARFIVTSPTGRVALDRDGNYANAHMPIDVPPDEAGKVWTLRVEPRQDVSLWLVGDVCPYLSATVEGVLQEEGTADG